MARHSFALHYVLDPVIALNARFGVRCPICSRTSWETLQYKVGERSGGLGDLDEWLFAKKACVLTIVTRGEDTSMLSSKIVGNAEPERLRDITIISYSGSELSSRGIYARKSPLFRDVANQDRGPSSW